MAGKQQAKRQKKPITQLSLFEWSCLVAAWRYYEHGATITSASFPRDIISRYWGKGNPYSDEVRDRIAHQFAHIDHSRGEADWEDTRMLCDKIPWTVFYQFCKAWCDGFTKLTLEDKSLKHKEEVEAFYTESDGKWREKNRYIESEFWYIDDGAIANEDK